MGKWWVILAYYLPIHHSQIAVGAESNSVYSWPGFALSRIRVWCEKSVGKGTVGVDNRGGVWITEVACGWPAFGLRRVRVVCESTTAVILAVFIKRLKF